MQVLGSSIDSTAVLVPATSVPYFDQETGKFAGFSIVKIPHDSPLSGKGLRKGDVITGVDDIVFDSVGKALGAFQGKNQVIIHLIRCGKPISLHVKLRN